MRVSAPSGDFEVSLKDASIEKDFVVLKAQVGIWDSDIYFSIQDLWRITKIFFRPSFLLLLKQFLRSF